MVSEVLQDNHVMAHEALLITVIRGGLLMSIIIFIVLLQTAKMVAQLPISLYLT